MKAVANFRVDLARIYVVRTSKRIACIQKVAAVADVDGVERNRPSLCEFLAYG